MLQMEKENCILNNLFLRLWDIIFSRLKHPHDRLADEKMIIGDLSFLPRGRKMRLMSGRFKLIS